MVMHHCEGGDLYRFVQAKRKDGKKVDEDDAWRFLLQMVFALAYLHAKKILHRDVKTQNIFLDKGKCQLGDFGLAKKLEETFELARTPIGTPFYMAPEIMQGRPYAFKSDVWALGCVMYEILTGKPAFCANNFPGVANKVLSGQYEPISSEYSAELRDVVSRMLCRDVNRRPYVFQLTEIPSVMKRARDYVRHLEAEAASRDLRGTWREAISVPPQANLSPNARPIGKEAKLGSPVQKNPSPRTAPGGPRVEAAGRPGPLPGHALGGSPRRSPKPSPLPSPDCRPLDLLDDSLHLSHLQINLDGGGRDGAAPIGAPRHKAPLSAGNRKRLPPLEANPLQLDGAAQRLPGKGLAGAGAPGASPSERNAPDDSLEPSILRSQLEEAKRMAAWVDEAGAAARGGDLNQVPQMQVCGGGAPPRQRPARAAHGRRQGEEEEEEEDNYSDDFEEEEEDDGLHEWRQQRKRHEVQRQWNLAAAEPVPDEIGPLRADPSSGSEADRSPAGRVLRQRENRQAGGRARQGSASRARMQQCLAKRHDKLKQKCISSLGYAKFSRLYDFLKERHELFPDEDEMALKIELSELLTESQMVNWPLVDELLYLEQNLA
mmetsp:Transcript_4441/g.10741  ORF Transcript_4441/g.10741 Transcript_4441/m.10741 type:complete len:603 (-) Transcript_4441:17-1825(-)